MKTSYNGYTASLDPNAIGVVPFVVSGVPFPGGVRSGDVHTVLHYVAEQFDKRVEKLQPTLGCWGYAYRQNRNADNLSCHASGTAIDCNAVRHPNGKRRTFTREQVAEIRKILAEVDGVVHWGGDFSTSDEMHFEAAGTAAVFAIVARRLARPPIPSPRPVSQEDDVTKDEVREVVQEELAKLYGSAGKDEDPTHISLADLNRKLNTIIEKLP